MRMSGSLAPNTLDVVVKKHNTVMLHIKARNHTDKKVTNSIVNVIIQPLKHTPQH